MRQGGKRMKEIYGLAAIFIFYSFAGWVFETTVAATREKQFINKGFLNGPVCPRYGFSMVLATMFLEPVRKEIIWILLGETLIGTVVEYISSVLLEKLTGSKWWDYTNSRFSFRGRINLWTLLFWAGAGTACFYLNQSFMTWLGQVEILVWFKVLMILFFILLLMDGAAAWLTVLALKDKYFFVLKIAARIRVFTKRLGNAIFENSSVWKMKQDIRKESTHVRNVYRKIREERMQKWFQERMILAAPELAEDEATFRRMLRKQKRKKRQMFQRILLNRVLTTAIALIAQIVWIAVILKRFASISQELNFFMLVISALITLYLLSKNENSAYKISWLVIISLMPVFGGLLYIFFGNKNPSRKMAAQIEKVQREKSGNLTQKQEVMEILEQENPRIAGRSRYLYQKTHAPVWQNTKTTYFPLGENMFEDMLAELEQAKNFIFLEFFIIEDGVFWGSIKEILTKKAKEGVDVRLMYDDIGCLMLLPKEYVKEMEAAGISCIAFNPFKPILSLAMNNRDHRKILVIDGHTAYTGGVNLADEYINMADRFGHWKDTGMKFVGDAAANFTEMFLEMWNAFRKMDTDFLPFLAPAWTPVFEEKEEEERITAVCREEGFVQPFGDTPLDDEPTAENLYIDLLNQASHYVYIYTPYLIISDTMRHALCMAAARGVDVKIVTPGIPDKKLIFRMTRSNYKELLKAGVEIYEYKQGFVHAKSYVSDDTDAVIGTINMDYRSLYLHFECGAYLHKTPSVLEMKEDFLQTLKKCRKIELFFLKQGFFQTVFDAILSVIAPLV